MEKLSIPFHSSNDQPQFKRKIYRALLERITFWHKRSTKWVISTTCNLVTRVYISFKITPNPTTSSTYQVIFLAVILSEWGCTLVVFKVNHICIFMSVEQTSPPKLVLKLLSWEVLHDWILKAVELKGTPTHKGCICKGFCLQTRLGGEISPSYVIVRKGQWSANDSIKISQV